MAKKNTNHLRSHQSLFKPGYPIQKGYIARLLLNDGRAGPDVIAEVQAIVQTTVPETDIHKGSLRSNVYTLKRLIEGQKN